MFKKIIQIKHFFQDSDGNNADDDSVNSFISSSINLNSGSHIDEIPTRDLGPERPGHLNYSQVSHLFSYSSFFVTHFFLHPASSKFVYCTTQSDIIELDGKKRTDGN